MKCTIPEISWHNRDPVLSLDIQASKNGILVPPYRLATGGTDSHVVIWYVTVKDCGLASVEVAADLQRHQRAVNAVRFSPSGQLLASGDDESVIIVWKPKTEHDISDLGNNEGEVNKEQWVSLKTLRGHLEDVYDLSWSMDSTHLISGSIDNTAIIWDVQKGRNLGILSGHGGFVQGVAWDPMNKYAATLSSDRTCRIHNILTKKLSAKISKTTLPVPTGSELYGKVVRLFHDDTLKSFFRRLSFSPDGKLLVTPSGIIEEPNSERHINATYIFSRYDFSRPVVYLPSPHEYTVAVRFCPLLFKLHESSSMFSLPYRMVFAVATRNNVILYDTQQPEPVALISNIHYTRLTDLSWSSDGRVLIASSTDGYCSIITFSEGELGEVYELPSVISESETEAPVSDIRQCDNSGTSGPSEIDSLEPNVSVSVKKGANKENVGQANMSKTSNSTKLIQTVNENKKQSRPTAFPLSETKSPRRITLITLSSPKKLRTKTSESELKKGYNESVSDEASIKDSVVEIQGEVLMEPKNATIDGKKQCGEKSSPIVDESAILKNNMMEDSLESIKISQVSDGCSKTFNESRTQDDMEPMEVDASHTSYSRMEEKEEESLNGREEFSNATNKVSSSQFTNSNVVLVSESEGEELKTKSFVNIHADDSITEECEKKTLKDEFKKKDNYYKTDEEVANSCGKSPCKISAADKCDITPSKCHSATTSRCILDEASCQQEVSCNLTPVEKRAPRRVQFITISSPKSKKKLM